MKKLHTSALQMQKLAGIITESEYNTEIAKIGGTTKMEAKESGDVCVIVVDKGQDELDVEEAFAPYTVQHIEKGMVDRPKYKGPAFTLYFDSKEEEFGTDMKQVLFDMLEESDYKGEVFNTNLTMNLKKEADKQGLKKKMYFHVLEDGGYGNIGHQGVYDTKEEAQEEADRLSDMFSDSSFYVEASDSEDEPVSVTV